MGYWDVHALVPGLIFLVGLAVFPRITLLFSNATGFGFLFWLGWVFVPHLTVAVLATIFYFKTNPILVLLSWLIALGGESKEKKIVRNYTYKKYRQTDIEEAEHEIIE